MKEVSHFSHRHPLHIADVKEEDEVLCSGCELELIGSSYNCTKPGCHFFLHQSCLELPRQIRHKSHPKHPLSLQISPPYSDGEFTCNACGKSGHAFTYHCHSYKFDLHVDCASLPEVARREDHEHPLALLYSFLSGGEKGGRTCDVCHGTLVNHCWVYSCLDCKYWTHLECGTGHESLIEV